MGSAPPKDPAATRAWLFRIAHNLVVDHYKRRHFPTLPDLGIDRADDASGLPERLIRTERLRAIDASIRRLPGRQRAAVYLRYYEELDYAEMAEVLGMPQVTIRSLVHRGLKRLAADLHGWEIP